MYFFTGDEHIDHKNVIRYCNRPFNDLDEMEKVLVNNHNSVVKANDIVIHAGDLTLGRKEVAVRYIKQLNGKHVFLKGCHDRWLSGKALQIWSKMVDSQFVVVCHWAMKTWARKHYGSVQLFAHSHGNLILTPEEAMCQYDIGVDNNSYTPVSFEQIMGILNGKKEDHR